MDKERDYCYGILGLQPGASAAEIKTAYRNLTKFYHPDRDKSPDSEIMYREIRTAYEKLLSWDHSGKTSTGPVDSRGFSKRTTHASSASGSRAYSRQTAGAYDNRDTSKQAPWTSEDWDYNDGNSYFSNVALAVILAIISFDSRILLLLISIFLPGTFSYWTFSVQTHSYGKPVALYYIVSWFFFIFIRHYFTPSVWPSFVKFVAGILYGATLVFLIAFFYAIPNGNILWTGIFATLSAWALID